MKKTRLVLTLGHKDLGTNLPEQKKAIPKTATLVGDLIQSGYQIAIVHSNAPQVGMIHTAMNEFGLSHAGYTRAPMSVCSAMSQGYIGYDLQNGIREELLRRGVPKAVSTILTQVSADPYDESFFLPVKKVGRIMSPQEAQAEKEKGNFTAEVPGKGFQRIFPSPKPTKIIEIEAIRTLLDADQIVIACGGGGIPVIEQGSRLKGAGAIIEKDLAAGLLAREIDGDILLILTSVDHVSLNFGTQKEQPIREMDPALAAKYIREGEFETASMLPKVEAGAAFVAAGPGKGRRAIITSFDKWREALKGRAGTTIREKTE